MVLVTRRRFGVGAGRTKAIQATTTIACLLLFLVAAATRQLGVQVGVMGFHPPSTKATFVSGNSIHQRRQRQQQGGPAVVLEPQYQVPRSTTASSRTSSSSSSAGSSSTSLSMFMGSDGGILGIGGPELFTILIVGYFILGPSDLYKLTKEIGKFITNARNLSTDLTTTFESNMESQLQLEEIRKAQRELNDAFSFRRSINVDEEGDAFSTTVTTPREGLREGEPIPGVEAAAEDATAAAGGAATAAAATAADAGTGPKKKIRRRVKKRVVAAEEAPMGEGAVPDLEMPAQPQPSPAMASSSNEQQQGQESYTEEELDLINKEFDQYTLASEEPPSPQLEDAETAQTRFQQQMSGNWNEQILQNEDKLGPVAQVMQKIALLEEEKMAATKRLEEEYAERANLEEEFYRKQRELLENAAGQVQKDAYVSMGGDSADSKS